MIKLIATCEPLRLNYLPQFVNHYRSQGVDEFLLSVQLEPNLPDHVVDFAYETAQKLSLKLDLIPIRPLHVKFDAMSLRAHHDTIQDTHCSEDDWIVWADIDEFHWFNGNLQELVFQWEQQGFNAARGQFIDRITRDGSLPVIDPNKPLWSQFPVGCNITKVIVQGLNKKVTVARQSVRIRHGNHDPVRHQKVNWARSDIPVFHFKWDRTVLERLRLRLTEDWKKRCHWWTQSDRVLREIFLNDNSIPLHKITTFDYLDNDDVNFHPYQNNVRYLEDWLDWQNENNGIESLQMFKY